MRLVVPTAAKLASHGSADTAMARSVIPLLRFGTVQEPLVLVWLCPELAAALVVGAKVGLVRVDACRLVAGADGEAVASTSATAVSRAALLLCATASEAARPPEARVAVAINAPRATLVLVKAAELIGVSSLPAA